LFFKEAVSKGQPPFIHTVWKNTSEKNLRNIVLAAWRKRSSKHCS